MALISNPSRPGCPEGLKAGGFHGVLRPGVEEEGGPGCYRLRDLLGASALGCIARALRCKTCRGED